MWGSLEAFDRKIDALHGSSYGHLTKTTLPEFARRLDALEARARPPMPPPTDNINPSDDETVKSEGVALEEDVDAGVDATTRSRQAWATSRARNGVDPNPSGNTTAGPPRALYTAPAGSGRGLLRNPVVSPYRPLATSFRDHTPLRQTHIPETMHGPRSKPSPAHEMTANQHPRVVGGAIISPRHSDRAIQAHSLGASRFNVIRLATPEYHVGMDGSDTLTEDVTVVRR